MGESRDISLSALLRVVLQEHKSRSVTALARLIATRSLLHAKNSSKHELPIPGRHRLSLARLGWPEE